MFASFHSVFSKVVRRALEDVFINLLCSNSIDFSLTLIFMKLFRTGSVAMVSECQKTFNFLPLNYQVDILTASLMLHFMLVSYQQKTLFVIC